MHARTQIRDAAIQAVTGLAVTGARVFAGRIYPLQEAELPGLCVYTNEEVSEITTNTTMSRELSLKIEIYVKNNNDFDALIDDIAADIEIAIAADAALKALIKEIHPNGIQKDLIKDGEKPIAIAVISFYCLYFTSHNNPEITK